MAKFHFYLWVVHCVCVYANDISDKGLISQICKELIQLNIKRANQLKNGQRIWIDNFPKKTYRWPADSEWSIWRYWTSLIIRERQTKYLIRCLQMMYLQGVNIHICVYIYHLSFTHWWTHRLLPYLGYCKQCCNNEGLVYVCVCRFSCARFFETPWTVARQTPLSMESSRQEYWSGLPCLPPGDLPKPGTEPSSPASQADSLLFELPRKPCSVAYIFSNKCFCLLQESTQKWNC